MAHSTSKLGSIDFILNRVMLQGKDSSDEEGKKDAKKPSSSSSSNKKTGGSGSRRGSKTLAEGDGSGTTKQYISTTSSTKDLLNKLADDFKPGEYDVVCSRGKWAMNAPGNVRYRTTIKNNLERYSKTTNKQEKSAIVSEIVENIKELTPQGGFVRCVNGTWYTVTDHIAREKTGQSFRDMLHHQYRSSTKAKRRRQKEKDLQESHAMIAAAQLRQASQARGEETKRNTKKQEEPKSTTGSSKDPPSPDGPTTSGNQDPAPQPPSISGSSSGKRPAQGSSASVGEAPDAMSAPQLSLSTAATNEVFPNIPNPSNYAAAAPPMMPHQPMPGMLPQMPLAFTAPGMGMPQPPQFMPHPFMYDLNHNHTHHMYPGATNMPLPLPANANSSLQLSPTQQDGRIDLEPIPIREAPLPALQGRQPDPVGRVAQSGSQGEIEGRPASASEEQPQGQAQGQPQGSRGGPMPYMQLQMHPHAHAQALAANPQLHFQQVMAQQQQWPMQPPRLLDQHHHHYDHQHHQHHMQSMMYPQQGMHYPMEHLPMAGTFNQLAPMGMGHHDGMGSGAQEGVYGDYPHSSAHGEEEEEHAQEEEE